MSMSTCVASEPLEPSFLIFLNLVIAYPSLKSPISLISMPLFPVKNCARWSGFETVYDRPVDFYVNSTL
jgi:hypothetical protein